MKLNPLAKLPWPTPGQTATRAHAPNTPTTAPPPQSPKSTTLPQPSPRLPAAAPPLAQEVPDGPPADSAAISALCAELKISQGSSTPYQLALICAAKSGEKTAQNFHAFGITDEKKSVAVAMACANNRMPLKLVEKFGITDETARVQVSAICASNICMWQDMDDVDVASWKDGASRLQLALAAAKGRPYTVDENLAAFQLPDEAAVLQVAKTLFDGSGRYMAKKPEDWGIHTQGGRVALGKLLATQKHYPEALGTLGIVNAEDRFDIAMRIMQRHGYKEGLIAKLGLQNSPNLRSLALACARLGDGNVVRCLAEFGLSDPSTRREIGVLVASNTHHFVGTLGLTDPEDLRQLALAFAPRSAARVIKQASIFGVLPYADRLHIARVAARDDGAEAIKHIQNFNLDPDDLLELAYTAAKSSAYAAKHIIRNIPLPQPTDREAIAFLIAQHASNPLPSVIAAFDIRDPAIREQLALLCAHSGEDFLQKLSDFKIESESARANIFKRSLDLSSYNMDKIEHACITSPALLRDIAQYAVSVGVELSRIHTYCPIDDPEFWSSALRTYAQGRPGDVVQLISYRGIDDPALRYEIAHICAQHESGNFAHYVQKFDVPEESQRIHLAKIAAQLDGYTTAKYIANFCITDKDALIDIARICATNGTLAYGIENFPLADNAALRAELAFLNARANGFSLAENLPKFDIQNSETLAELAFLCVECCESIYSPLIYLHHFAIQDPHVQREVIARALCARPDGIAGAALAAIDPHLSKVGMSFVMFGQWQEEQAMQSLGQSLKSNLKGSGSDFILDYVRAIPDPHTREQVTARVAASLLILQAWLTPAHIKAFNERGLLAAVFHMRAPELYVPTISLLARLFYERDDLLTMDVLKPLRIEGATPYGNLVRAFCAAMINAGIDPQRLIDWLEVPAVYRVFKDTTKQRVIIKAMAAIVQSSGTTARKQALLDSITSYEAAKDLVILTDLGATDLLANESLQPSCLAQKALSDRLDLSTIPDAATRLASTFGKSRAPDAVWQLLSKAEATEEPAVKRAFSTFFNAVLMGTFKKLRYALGSNPQLQKLESLRAGIVSIYATALPQSPVAPAQATETFDANQWLTDKLIHNGHLSGVDITYITAALRDRDPSAERRCAEANADNASPELAFQLACFALLKSSGAKAQTASLTAIMRAMAALPNKGGEFGNDAAGRLKIFQQSNSARTRPLKIIDTDDFTDIMLCGTEVAESCQRLDGNPKLNKGLLGYLLHGQTRMLAVVDEKSGRIVARTLIRLLHDGKKPVLFMENLYGDARYAAALTEQGKAKAAQLGVAFTMLQESAATPYGKTLISEGGIAPHEYCDGIRGLAAYGKFAIENASLLWSPPNAGAEKEPAPRRIHDLGLRLAALPGSLRLR